jgi:hypothetical protein
VQEQPTYQGYNPASYESNGPQPPAMQMHSNLGGPGRPDLPGAAESSMRMQRDPRLAWHGNPAPNNNVYTANTHIMDQAPPTGRVQEHVD